MVSSVRRVLLAGLLVVGAVIWAKIDKPIEGRTLLELTPHHGLTTADLLSVVMLAMALVLAWPAPRGTTGPTASRPASPGRPPGTTAGPARR
jgi:hypothetical protein